MLNIESTPHFHKKFQTNVAEILKLQQIETSPLPSSCVPQILIHPFTSNRLFKEHRNQGMNMGELQNYSSMVSVYNNQSLREESGISEKRLSFDHGDFILG